jgi:uncharacterized protein (TIGR03435 family)
MKPFTLDCDKIQADRDAALKAGQPPATNSNGAPLCGYIWSGAIASGGLTMQAFAGMLDFVAGRVVVDRTGLKGRYEFTVRFRLGCELPQVLTIRLTSSRRSRSSMVLSSTATGRRCIAIVVHEERM